MGAFDRLGITQQVSAAASKDVEVGCVRAFRPL